MRAVLAALTVVLAPLAWATVPSETSTVSYACNGTTTVYAYSFKILASTDLVVTATTAAGSVTSLVLTTDYSVSGIGVSTGGNVTLTAGSKCPNLSTLKIVRTVTKTQTTSFRTQGSFNPAVHENAFDKLTMETQQIDRDVGKLMGRVCGIGQILTSTDGVNLTCVNDNGSSPVADSSTVTATGSTTARALRDVHSDVKNVLSFGAVGNGAIDDGPALDLATTAACRAALDTFEWNQGVGGTVFLPRGIYRRTTTWTIPDNCNGLRIVGEGSGTTSILMDANATTDAIVAASNRKLQIKGIWIYAFSATPGVLPGKFRDGVKLGSSAGVGGISWGDLEDVKVSYADGYGFRILRALDSKMRGCGTRYTKTGLLIDADGSGVESTTVEVSGFTSSTSTEHGVIVNKAYGVSFNQLTVEGAGTPATAANANGLLVGPLAEVTLTHPYFESNAGWDIATGLDATNYSRLVVVNPSARYTANKGAGYGFLKIGARTQDGALVGGAFTGGYGSGNKVLSIASGARNFLIASPAVNTDSTSVEYNSGPLSGYNGVVLGGNGLAEGMIEGRYKFRIFGGPLVTQTAGAPPASGTWAAGDISFNQAPAAGAVEGWRCTTGGTPGTWTAFYPQRWKRAQTGPTYGANVAIDASLGDVFAFNATDGVAFQVDNPTNPQAAGHMITIRVANTSGGALGAVTFGTQYKLAGAWTSPANGNNRTITFEWNTANWIEVSRTAADAPN